MGRDHPGSAGRKLQPDDDVDCGPDPDSISLKKAVPRDDPPKINIFSISREEKKIMCMRRALEALENSIIAETGLCPRIEIRFYDCWEANSILSSGMLAQVKAEQLSQVFDEPAHYGERNGYQWYSIGDVITLYFNQQAENVDLVDVSVPI